MKEIKAIIRPEKFEDVRAALERCGYPGIMLSEIEGHGKQKGIEQVWRGEKFRQELIPKIKIEIVVSDADSQKIVSEILKAAATGNVGDGKIFVTRIDDAYRIRTGENGDKAL